MGTFVVDIDPAELLDMILGIANGNGALITPQNLADQLLGIGRVALPDGTMPTLEEALADLKVQVGNNKRGVKTVAELATLNPMPGDGVLVDVTKDPADVDGSINGTYQRDAASPAAPPVPAGWFKTANGLSVVKALADLLNNVTRRVVVPGNEIIVDRLGQQGGGTGQHYVSRNWFVDMPGLTASNVTVTNADSVEKPGWSKLAIPAGLRSFTYLDLTDSTIKNIAATSGDFVLPTTAPDKIVPIIVFPSGASGYGSPYRVRELNPASTITPFATVFPIAHSRATNKVLIPSATVRNDTTVFSHVVPAANRYEEFDVAASNTAIVTYWYDFKSNTYKATLGGGAPYAVDPTIGIVIGWSWGGEFFSPWPHIGRMGQAAGKNDFAWGKGDRLLQAPRVWDDNRSSFEMVDVVDTSLIAAGFTRALRSKDTVTAWPYVGDKIPDSRAGQPFFGRIWLEATVDNTFGSPTIRFYKANGVSVSVPLVLEKTLSTRARIYSVPEKVPDWQLTSPEAGEFTYALLGTGLSGGAPQVHLAGVQNAFGQRAQWIELNDFPTTPALGIRVSNLEAQAGGSDPEPSLLYGRDMWTIRGRIQWLQIDNIWEARTERKGVLTTLFAPNPSVADLGAKHYEETKEAGSFRIDPAEVGNTAWLWAKRYSDTGGSHPLGRSYRSDPIVVHKASSSGKAGAVTAGGSNVGNGTLTQGTPFVDPAAPAGNYAITVLAGAEAFSITGPVGYTSRGVIGAAFDGPINFTLVSGPTPFVAGDTWTVAVSAKVIRYLGTGDSIQSQTRTLYVRQILLDRGNAVTMSGTIGPAGNEGRAGWTFTDHIYARTDKPLVTNWAAYMAASDATRMTMNPWTRAATGADPSAWVFNGRIFDPAPYLTNTGIAPPTHVMICLGTNDIGSYSPAEAATWIRKGLDVMVHQWLNAVPTVQIGIGLPTLPRMALADARWDAAYGLAIREFLDFERTLASNQVKVLPIWAHINQVTGFSGSEVVVSTDPDTGMVVLDNGDMLHPSPNGLHPFAEVETAWAACTSDGM